MKCLVVYNYTSLGKERCAIVESDESLNEIQKEIYNLGDYFDDTIDEVFGSNFSFWSAKTIGDPKFGNRIVPLTEEQLKLIIELFEEKKISDELELKQRKNKEKKLKEEDIILKEELKEEFKNLQKNFSPQKFTIWVEGKKKIIEFLELETEYTYIISYNNGPKQKACICFKDTVPYPILKLETDAYLKINSQKAIDYLWKSLGCKLYGKLYGFTTDFKRNYVE